MTDKVNSWTFEPMYAFSGYILECSVFWLDCEKILLFKLYE